MHILVRGKREGDPRRACPACPSDAVDVIFRAHGQIEIRYMGDRLDIDARAPRHRWQRGCGFPIASQAGDRPGPLPLVHIAMESAAAVHCRELIGQWSA